MSEETLDEPVLISTQQCPRCNAELPVENKFCEECGANLASPLENLGGCAKCGAPPDRIEDGFCSACGFRQEEPGRNRMEKEIAPWFAGVSDRGIRHKRNEDFMALEWIETLNACVLVVCDGVSSTRDADRASEAGANEARRFLVAAVTEEGSIAPSAMRAAIEGARKAVEEVPYTKISGQDSPATTIVAAVAWPDRIAIGWLGDSRAYWIGENGARQLTVDHSWMTEMVADGEMTAEEAAESPHAHAITRWLGADAPEVEIPVAEFPVDAPGHLLVCSDGLWNYAATPEAIAGLILHEEEAIATARSLVAFANEQGGHDNITAVLLSFKAGEWSKEVDDEFQG